MVEAGYKPILFGDFDYYWIIDRSPFTLKILTELFIESSRYGYVGSEFLDARLVRRDAIKAIIINGEVDENYVFQD